MNSNDQGSVNHKNSGNGEPERRVHFIEGRRYTSQSSGTSHHGRYNRRGYSRKRTYSLSLTEGLYRHKKRCPGQCPQNFLMGGSITDPLNLTALEPRHKERPLKTVPVMIPANINDPLNLCGSSDSDDNAPACEMQGSQQPLVNAHRMQLFEIARRRRKSKHRKRRFSEPGSNRNSENDSTLARPCKKARDDPISADECGHESTGSCLLGASPQRAQGNYSPPRTCNAGTSKQDSSYRFFRNGNFFRQRSQNFSRNRLFRRHSNAFRTPAQRDCFLVGEPPSKKPKLMKSVSAIEAGSARLDSAEDASTEDEGFDLGHGAEVDSDHTGRGSDLSGQQGSAHACHNDSHHSSLLESCSEQEQSPCKLIVVEKEIPDESSHAEESDSSLGPSRVPQERDPKQIPKSVPGGSNATDHLTEVKTNEPVISIGELEVICNDNKDVQSLPVHISEASKPKQTYNPRNAFYQYGNYLQYYGYRNPDHTTDIRLAYLNPRWFADRDVLDIGCNSGCVTIAVARDLLPRTVTGLDIDGKLVAMANRNLKHFIKKYKEGLNYGQKSIKQAYPPSFAKVYQMIPEVSDALTKAEGVLGSKNTKTFPFNVKFLKANYVPENELLLEMVRPQYDLILCLSVTKWVHLNWGDDGLKRFFWRIYKNLRPGGKLVLEAQPWSSYLRRKKLTENIFQNFKNIRFLPDQFEHFLLHVVGFLDCLHVATPLHPSKGFQRPIVVYNKADATAALLIETARLTPGGESRTDESADFKIVSRSPSPSLRPASPYSYSPLNEDSGVSQKKIFKLSSTSSSSSSTSSSDHSYRSKPNVSVKLKKSRFKRHVKMSETRGSPEYFRDMSSHGNESERGADDDSYQYYNDSNSNLRNYRPAYLYESPNTERPMGYFAAPPPPRFHDSPNNSVQSSPYRSYSFSPAWGGSSYLPSASPYIAQPQCSPQPSGISPSAGDPSSASPSLSASPSAEASPLTGASPARDTGLSSLPEAFPSYSFRRFGGLSSQGIGSMNSWPRFSITPSQSTAYNLASPRDHGASQSFSPPSPAYNPPSPAHAPSSPIYNPQSPAYAGPSSAYNPPSPTYAPTSPAYNPLYRHSPHNQDNGYGSVSPSPPSTHSSPYVASAGENAFVINPVSPNAVIDQDASSRSPHQYVSPQQSPFLQPSASMRYSGVSPRPSTSAHSFASRHLSCAPSASPQSSTSPRPAASPYPSSSPYQSSHFYCAAPYSSCSPHVSSSISPLQNQSPQPFASPSLSPHPSSFESPNPSSLQYPSHSPRLLDGSAEDHSNQSLRDYSENTPPSFSSHLAVSEQPPSQAWPSNSVSVQSSPGSSPNLASHQLSAAALSDHLASQQSSSSALSPQITSQHSASHQSLHVSCEASVDRSEQNLESSDTSSSPQHLEVPCLTEDLHSPASSKSCLPEESITCLDGGSHERFHSLGTAQLFSASDNASTDPMTEVTFSVGNNLRNSTSTCSDSDLVSQLGDSRSSVISANQVHNATARLSSSNFDAVVTSPETAACDGVTTADAVLNSVVSATGLSEDALDDRHSISNENLAHFPNQNIDNISLGDRSSNFGVCEHVLAAGCTQSDNEPEATDQLVEAENASDANSDRSHNELEVSEDEPADSEQATDANSEQFSSSPSLSKESPDLP